MKKRQYTEPRLQVVALPTSGQLLTMSQNVQGFTQIDDGTTELN